MTDSDGSGRYVVISTMKNEGAFLVEWVAHHKALGFDDLVICTNDCEDGTDRMVQRLQKMGLARHHPTFYRKHKSIQRAALRQAARYEEVRRAEWVWVCDADEFLTVRLGDGTVRALAAAATPEAEVISVPWRIFGSDGRRGYEEGQVTRQFRRANRAPPPGKRMGIFPKSLFRAALLPEMERIGTHQPIEEPGLGRSFRRELPGGVAHEAGFKVKLHVQRDYRFAQVNHYALRSRDSFLVKRDRGKVNHINKEMEFDYWGRYDVAQEQCDAIRRYDEAAAEWTGRLLSDRRLNTLHGRAVRWHRARIAELRERPDFQEMIAAIDERQAMRAGAG